MPAGERDSPPWSIHSTSVRLRCPTAQSMFLKRGSKKAAMHIVATLAGASFLIRSSMSSCVARRASCNQTSNSESQPC
jgi:hypothetical protein